MFPLPDDQLSAMAAAGVLSAIPNQEEVSAANTAESVAAASINGVMYAYPMTADNGYFLYYNKKFLNESDVSSLERILEVCEEKNKEFSMEFNSGWYMYSFFGNTGLELGLNDDGVTNYCTWNSTDNSIKGADVVNRMMELTSSPAFVNRADGDLPAALASGKIIAAISGVWNSTDVEKAFGSDYGACKPHLSGRGKAGADGVVHRLQNDGRQLLQRAPRMGAQTRGLVHKRAEPDAFL